MMLPGLMARQALTPPAQRDAVRDRWVGAWGRLLLGLFGVEAVVCGEPARAPGGRLVVANHRSTADVLLLLKVFGGAMVSRADVAGWPLVGQAARAVDTVFVNRSDAFSGATAVRAISARLSRPSTVIVFPEGTTFSDDDVRPFHMGAFMAALRCGADVVPVGIAYASGSGAAFFNETFASHLSRMAAADPSRVAMCVGEPIEFDPAAGAARLRDKAHTEVTALVAQARRVVDG
jgi:1-acyl-sn-glycerol-3-phosphate acyltransferase